VSFQAAGVRGSADPVRKITQHTLREKKERGEPITALTAYDYPTARMIDEAGIDLILVGDSVAMTVLGYDSTLPLTMDEMMHHARAVRRGVRSSLLVVDMPYGSYHETEDAAVSNAIRFVKEAGAEAVKLEGGAQFAPLVERLTRAEVQVVGHIGLTPQSLHRMGGYRVQGRATEDITRLMLDAQVLDAAGAVAVVVEGVPREVAARITAAVEIPVIGIGAGPECDGQILVWHDLLRLGFGGTAKFVRSFGDAGATMREALELYREAVETRTFPSDAESYHLPGAVRAELERGLAVPQTV
jgi:3-methyl-2-oxobutanoate hydroxymethyltransferase